MGSATLNVKLLQKVAALREVVIYAIFLDLQKAYNALGRSRCLDILKVCGVGPRDLCLFRMYWESLNMVAHAGGYYVEPFREERGVIQGDPLSPTIFNVVVDTVVHHGEYLVAEREGRYSSDDKGDVAQMTERRIWD